MKPIYNRIISNSPVPPDVQRSEKRHDVLTLRREEAAAEGVSLLITL